MKCTREFGADAWKRTSLAGQLARLSESDAMDVAALIAAGRLQDLVSEVELAPRRWARSLDAASKAALEQQAVRRAEALGDDLEDLFDTLSADMCEASLAWRRLCHRRDDIESVRVLLREGNAGVDLEKALESADRTGRAVRINLDRTVSAADERLRRVALGDPSAWWGSTDLRGTLLLMAEAPDSALRAGPWCWPRSDARCERLAQRLGPMPRASRGALPVVSVSEDDDSVVAWCIAANRHGTAHSHGIGTTLGPQMRLSWRAATVALPRAVPVLWRNVRDATRLLPEITPLHGLRRTPGFVDPGLLVEGPSFGLAFCLHLASIVLGCPMPPHVVAAAAIDPSGSVLPVGGLERKIAGIAVLLPRVTDVLVSADQEAEARHVAPAGLHVVGIGRAADAIEHVFGNALSRLLVDAGSDPERREELTASFFRLALVGSDAMVDWAPVARGARLALESWSDLTADARYRLDFARAVAERHCDNSGHIPMPPSGWLEGRPRMLRIQVVAHLVQQCADTGVPHPERIEPLARDLLAADLHEAAEPQLRLRGALARLEALTGRAHDALAAQESRRVRALPNSMRTLTSPTRCRSGAAWPAPSGIRRRCSAPWHFTSGCRAGRTQGAWAHDTWSSRSCVAGC